MHEGTVSSPHLVSVVAEDPRVAQVVREAGDRAEAALRRPVLVSLATLDPEDLASSDLVVLDLSTAGPHAMDLMMEAVQSAPHVSIFALVRPGDPDVISRAMVAGAGAVARFTLDDPDAAAEVNRVVLDFLSKAKSRPQAGHGAPRGSLARSHPERFGTFVRRYAREVLLKSDRRTGAEDAKSQLGLLAEDLASTEAAPVDLTDVHVVALRALCRDTSTAGQRRLVHDARVVLVECMGLLAGLYRDQALYGSAAGGADDGALA